MNVAQKILLFQGPGEIRKVCPTITPTLGADLITNGNMETGNPPTGWNATNATLTGAADERTGGAGAQSLNIARNGADTNFGWSTYTAAIGSWVSGSAWLRKVDGVNMRLYLQESGTRIIQSSDTITDVAWTYCTFTARIQENAAQRYHARQFSNLANGTSGRADDMALYPITFATMHTLLGTRKRVYGSYQCRPTVAANTQCGMLIRYLDDDNFVQAIVDRRMGQARLIKKTGGTWSADQLSGAITYGSEKILKVTIATDGVTYSMTYDGAAVGATATINDALGYQVHGFNAYAGNTVGLVETLKN